MIDPYRAIGVRGNPFVCDDPRVLPDSLWLDRNLPPAPEPGARRVVQVIGVRGAGKTSLLSRWHRATGGVYRWVPATLARWRLLPCAPSAYWDEADRAPRLVLDLSLRRARRCGATVVLGTHTDLSGVVTRAGLRLQTVILPAPDADTLAAWAALRIAAVALTGSTADRLRLDHDTARTIAFQAEGSWRRAGDLLHAWAAEQSLHVDARRGAGR